MVKDHKKLREFKFSYNMVDPRGNIHFTYFGDVHARRMLPYYQPEGWLQIGLYVEVYM